MADQQMLPLMPLLLLSILSLPTLLRGEMPSQDTAQTSGGHYGPVRRDADCEVVCGYNQQLQGGGVQEYAWCCGQGDDCAFDGSLEKPYCVASLAASTGVVTSVLSMPRETVTSTATYTKLSTLTSAVTRATTLRSVSTLTSAVTISPTAQTHQTSAGSPVNTATPTPTAISKSETQKPSVWHHYGIPILGAIGGALAIGLIIYLAFRWWRKRQDAKAAAAGKAGDFQPQNFALIERNESSRDVRQDRYAPMLQPRPSMLRQGRNPYEAGGSPAPPYPGSRSQTPVQAYGDPDIGGSYGEGSMPRGRAGNWHPDAVPASGRQPGRPRRPVGGRPARADSGEEY